MKTLHDLLAPLAGLTDRNLVVSDRRGRRHLMRSWAEVYSRSLCSGQSLLAGGCEPGDHVFLQLPNSSQLIEGFLGAIAVGLRPCCLASPRALGGLDTFRERMRLLLERFPRSRLVAFPEVGDAAGVRYLPPLEDFAGTPAMAPPALAPPEDVDPEAIAFIQLTSGATCHPKAVRISHRALLANVRNLREASESRHDDSIVTWLPFYHDMGLVGMLLFAIGLRADLHVLQPETFLARPRTWLRVISDIPGWVTSSAPNFGYQHCVQRIPADHVASLDLSRWRIAGCGAERVRATTLDAFTEHFAPAGFNPESFVPCYGMAEMTLAVTCGPGKAIPVVHDGNVSCGRPIPETEVVIRDPDGSPLADCQQGVVTIQSSSLCSGYVSTEPEANDGITFREGWLYTGDRGYLLDGELYITGRYKDLIIVDGVSIDPDEIEAIAEDRGHVAGGRSVAFSVDLDGRDRVVLVVEAGGADAETFAGWNRKIGDGVARIFGFNLYDMVFVRRGSINKSSSGKVQRAKLRERYRQGTLETLWRQRYQCVEGAARC